ncbi:hypothetical protein CAEBREN_01983 [Caenorhabditis brenneri]|uniref:Skp1-related protein n=1 Tax=Caenorhabditis brenneri TaxID=135651 RepID=G0MCF1_CAEBE|nr:hypothetical protein CAEBREN_01983 [Caenorhabditis brenneri]
MSVTVEVPIKFQDQTEPSVLRDVAIIQKCPVLVRAIESKNPDWATDGVQLKDAIEIPQKKAAGDFVFTHTLRYEAPDMDKDDAKVEDYKEANNKTLEELKEIIECASFLENSSMMHAVGFIIAKKMDTMTVEDIAEYLGTECLPEAQFFDETDGWVHAPQEVFQNN